MKYIGNVSLMIAALVTCLVVYLVFKTNFREGSENQKIMNFVVVVLGVGMFALLSLAAFAIGREGGFSWISGNKIIQFVVAGVGLLGAMMTVIALVLIKDESKESFSPLYIFPSFFIALIPVVMLFAGFMLLNESWQTKMPALAWKAPLIGVFIVGLLGLGDVIAAWITSKKEADLQLPESQVSDKIRYHRQSPDYIAVCDASSDMEKLLVFTDPRYDAAVRSAALAKIKSNPNWQKRLIELLQSDAMLEAFVFLSYNDVDNPELFEEPLRMGILLEGDWVNRSIWMAKSRAELTEDKFLFETERVLATVDKFEARGIDYSSDLKRLRDMFDTFTDPPDLKKAPSKAAELLDQWLEKHPPAPPEN